MMTIRIFQGCAILAIWILTTAAAPPSEQSLIDEKSSPKYEYGYVVSDQQGGTQGHVESRDGSYALGRYYINLPNGSEQKVTYFADNWGYHPLVSYTSTTASGTSRIEFAMGDKATAALKETVPTVVPTMNVSPELAAGVQILSHGSSGHSLPPSVVSTTPQPVEVSSVSGTSSPILSVSVTRTASPSVVTSFRTSAQPAPSPTPITSSVVTQTPSSGIHSSTEITNEVGSPSPTVQQYVPSVLDSVPLGLAPFLLHGVSPSYKQSYITPPPPVQVKKENVVIVTPSAIDNSEYLSAIDHNSIVNNETEGSMQFTHKGQNIKITSYLADTNKVLYYGDRIGVKEVEDSEEQRLIDEIQEHAKQRILKDLQEKEIKQQHQQQQQQQQQQPITTLKPIVVSEDISDQINYLGLSTTQAPVHVSPPSEDALSQSVNTYNSGQSGHIAQNEVSYSTSTSVSTSVNTLPTAEPLVDLSNSVSEKSEVTKIYRSVSENPVLITPRPNEIAEQLAPLQAGISILSAPEASYSSQSAAPESGYLSQSSAPEASYAEQPDDGYLSQSPAPESDYASPSAAPVSGYASPSGASLSGYASPSAATLSGYASPSAASVSAYASPTAAPVVEENKDDGTFKTVVDIEEGIALKIQENPDGSIQLSPDNVQNEVSQPTPTQYAGLGYEQRLVNPEHQQVVQESDPVLRDQKQNELLLKQQSELAETQQNIQELQQKIINEIDAHHEEEQRKHEIIHVERTQHLENLQKIDSLTREASNIQPVAEQQVSVTPNYGTISSYQTPEHMIIVTPEPNTNQVEIQYGSKEDEQSYLQVSPIHPTAQTYGETYGPQGENSEQVIIENKVEAQELSPPPAPPAIIHVEVEKPVYVPKPTVIETTKVVEVEKPIVVKEPIAIEQTKVVEVEKPVPVVQPYPVEITKVVHVDRPVAVPAPYGVAQPVPIPFAIPHAVGVPTPYLIPYPELFPILHKEYHPIIIHKPHYMKPSIRVPDPIFKEAAREVYAQSHYYHTIPLHLKLAAKHKGHYSHSESPKSHHHKIYQQPHSGRNKNVLKNLRIEYGFKPPLKPSLEIKEEPKLSIYGPSVRPE